MAAVLVVSTAVPLLRVQMEPDLPDVATPPPNESTLPKGPFLSGVDFYDADHGYAIRSTCRSGNYRKCADELLVTEDGEHWESRRLARPEDAPSWSRGYVVALGPDELAVTWGLSAVDESVRLHRIHSTDAGRTWERVDVPSAVTATVPAIPDDAELVTTCAELIGGGHRCAERGFAVLLPGSGETALLANQPKLTAMVAGTEQTADGQWWVAGRDPKTNRWGLSISDDDGRTWRTTVLSFRESTDLYGWSVVSANGVLYASAIGALPNTSNGLLAIFRSTDGGRTWERTWQPRDDKAPRRVFPALVAAADGTLTINTPDGKAYASHDGGRTFAETAQRYADYAYWTRIGYLARGTEGGPTIEMSADGIDWRKVRIG